MQLSGRMEQGRQCCVGEWRAEQKWGAAIEGDPAADRGPAFVPSLPGHGYSHRRLSFSWGVLCLSLQNHCVSFSRGVAVGPSLLTSLRTPNKTEVGTCLLDSTELSQPLWRPSMRLWDPTPHLLSLDIPSARWG